MNKKNAPALAYMNKKQYFCNGFGKWTHIKQTYPK